MPSMFLKNALLFVTLCLLWPAGVLHAKDYRVEIILFEHVNGGADINTGLSYPRLRSAIGLSSDAAASNGFTLLEDGYELNEAAAEIRASGRYRLLKHFIWQQPGLDRKSAIGVRVNVGRVSTMYVPESFPDGVRFVPATSFPQSGTEREIRTTTVNGSLKVRLGRFLHLETHLVFTDTDRKTSYNLFQSRKMRSRELHYIDNARFGLLARIVPVEDGET